MIDKLGNIERKINFRQPVEKVWRAITDAAQIKQWFGSDCVFEFCEGGEGYFEWEEECEGKFAMKIETINEPHYFAWRWMLKEDIPFDKTQSTLVEWHLSKTDKGTLLRLTESGFVDAKHVEMNIQGWDQELADLQAFVN